MKDIDVGSLMEYDPITNKNRCMVCNKEYSYPSGCYNHIKKKHKEEVIKVRDVRNKVPSNIKAKIAVAASGDGTWCAYGDSSFEDRDVKQWALDSVGKDADFMWVEVVINPSLTAVEKLMLQTQGITDTTQSVCDRTNISFERAKEIVDKYVKNNKIDIPKVKK